MTTLSRTLRAAGLYGLGAQPWFMGVKRVTIDPIFHAKMLTSEHRHTFCYLNIVYTKILSMGYSLYS